MKGQDWPWLYEERIMYDSEHIHKPALCYRQIVNFAM